MRRKQPPPRSPAAAARVGGYVCAAVLLANCAPKSGSVLPGRPNRMGRPALHAVHSERLRRVMNEIDRVAIKRMPQELGDAYAPHPRAREVAQVASDLAEAAGHIPEVLSEVRLGHEHRRVFEDLARKLQEQAQTLRDLAMRGAVDGAMDRWHAILKTCSRCHGAFRVMPAVPPPE